MTQANPFLSIDTPENVVFGYEVAGLGSRFLAALIDSIAIVLLQIVAVLVLAFFIGVLELNQSLNENWIIAIFGILLFGLLWGYYIVFELLWNGQTPGKRYFNLRVLRTDGLPTDLTATMIRNLVRIIDFLPIFYSLGTISMFISLQSRRLGDYAAGTLVVHDKETSLEQLENAQRFKYPPGMQVPAELDLALERLDSADLVLAESYLQRRNDLTNAPQLLRPILQHLYDKMEVELEPQLRYSEALNRLTYIVYTTRRQNSLKQPLST